MAETSATATRIVELVDDLELHLFNGNKYHLCNALAWLNLVGLGTSIPDRNKHLALVIGINEAGQVTENQSMFVAQAGTWQKHSGKSGIANMDGKAGRNQNGCAGLDREHVVNTCPHIKASRAVRRIVWQWNTLANPRVQYLQFN
jgi:hypothetical protein